MRFLTVILICLLASCADEASDPQDIFEELYAEDTTAAEVLVTDGPMGLITQHVFDSTDVIMKVNGFTIRIPDIYSEGSWSDPIMSASKASYDLFLMHCDDIFGDTIRIEDRSELAGGITVEQQCSYTYFFNEDGSGGVWQEESIEIVEGEWRTIDMLPDGSWITRTREEIEAPDMSQDADMRARQIVSEREWETYYFKDVLYNRFRFTWMHGEQTHLFVMEFGMIYGD